MPCDACGRAEGDENMYATPLNALIKNTLLRSPACTSRRLSMFSTPSCFVARNCQRAMQICSLWVYDLHARSCDAVLDLFGSNRLQDLQNSIHQGSSFRLTLTLVQQIVVSYFN